MSLYDPSFDTTPQNEGGTEPEAGADERLGLLFERIRLKLTVWLEREFGSGPPQPEDVVQHTFAKLAARGDLRSIKYLETYAWTTAINFVRDEKRTQSVAENYLNEQRNGFWKDEHDEFDPERILQAKDELKIVADALQSMPERRRTIFMANRFEGLSQEEAGRRAGVSRNAAVRHIAIATDQIVEALAAGRSNDAGLIK